MPRPVLQALVLADHVYKDVFTGRWSLPARSIGCALPRERRRSKKNLLLSKARTSLSSPADPAS